VPTLSTHLRPASVGVLRGHSDALVVPGLRSEQRGAGLEGPAPGRGRSDRTRSRPRARRPRIRIVTEQDPRHFWAVLSGAVDHQLPSLATLCQRCVALLPVSGAAISLMTPAQSPSVASAFDGRARAVQDMEFTLGEGPAMDAFAQGASVLVPDVRSQARRWPQFCGAVAAMGVEAVFALPLLTPGASIGVLVLYRD
jgi:hypothetical protein